MESPSTNNAPVGAPGAPAATDEFWAFNPQQPPPVKGQNQDDTSLDELLALYQTAQDAPGAAPFAPMGEPESYPGFPSFGGDAGAGFGFGDPATDQPFGVALGHADPFGAPAHDAFGAPAHDAFGAPAHDAFAAPAAFGAPAHDAFGAPSDFGASPDAFGGGGFDFNAPPAFDAGAHSGDPFGGLPSAHPEGEFSFGGDAGALPDFAPAHDQAPFGTDAAAHTSFGTDAPHADPFGAPMAQDPFAAANAASGADAFGGVDPFGGADPFAAPLVAPAHGAEFGGLDDLFGGDAGPVFPPLDATPPPQTPPAAVHGAVAPIEELEEFVPDDDAPLFPPLDAAPTFEAFDPTPPGSAVGALPADDLFGGDAGPVFAAFDEPFVAAPEAHGVTHGAAAGAPEDDLFGGDMGPVFPAYEEPSLATSAASHPAVAAPEDDLFGGDSGPVYGAFEEAPIFTAFEEPLHEPAPPEAPAIDFMQAFPEAAVTPVVATPTETVAPKSVEVPVVAASADPNATSRLNEAPNTASPQPVSLPAQASAMASGQEVAIRSLDERTVVNQQVTQVVGSLASQLDAAQAKLAHLYAELQRAAVRRASVGEINDITSELGQTRAQLGEGSEAYKQALYLRHVADAYLQLLREL